MLGVLATMAGVGPAWVEESKSSHESLFASKGVFGKSRLAWMLETTERQLAALKKLCT